MKTVMIIDGRFASKVAQKIGKGKQTIDFESLQAVLVSNFDCTLTAAHYLAPCPNALETIDPLEKAKRETYHRRLAGAPPKGPGLLVRELENRAENCVCPMCSKDFQAQIQNGVEVQIVTQTLKSCYMGGADCVAIMAGDGGFVQGIRVIREVLKRELICITSRGEAPEFSALATKTLFLEDIWDFIAKSKARESVPALRPLRHVEHTASQDSPITPSSDFSDIEPSFEDLIGYEDVNLDAVVAEASRSTFDRRIAREDYGILMAEERRRRKLAGMISIEQEIEDRKMALKLQAEENARARGR